jgi:hypothetical protein
VAEILAVGMVQTYKSWWIMNTFEGITPGPQEEDLKETEAAAV